MGRFSVAACAAAVALWAGSASAATIFDSGAPFTISGGGLYSQQWFAAAIDISERTTITDVSSYMGRNSEEIPVDASDLVVTVALYADGALTPGADLFSQDFSISWPTPEAWQGVSGLSWTVDPGRYWFGFEVRDHNPDRDGAKLFGATIPAAGYARATGPPDHSTLPTAYALAPQDAFSLRVNGDVIGVPEPQTWALLIGGFALTGAALRRRRYTGTPSLSV